MEPRDLEQTIREEIIFIRFPAGSLARSRREHTRSRSERTRDWAGQCLGLSDDYDENKR